jgi:type III secretion protein D
MPPATTRQALLKVISGPHAGAELLLSEGRNTIGRDDACDIVLHDGTLAECHAAFEVSNGTVVVEAVDESPLHVDGQPTTRLQLRPFQVVTIGETHLAIGPSNEPWPALVPPTITAAMGPAETAAAQPHAEPPKPQPTVVVAPARNRRSGIAAVVVSAVVLLLFGWWWNMGDARPMTSAADARADLRKRLDEVLKKFRPGSDLSIDERPNGLAVNGYVATPEVRRDLTTAVKELPGPIRNNVVDTAGLAEAAGRVLKMHKVEFTTAPGGPGEVIVSGVTKDLASWNKIKPRVAADVPKIRTLTDHVRRPGETPPPPQAQITQSAPAVQAEAPPQPGPEPGPEPAPAAVAAAPPKEAAVALKIRSITVGTFRSLVLESGEKVFEGAVLPSGHTIKSIAADKVILEKSGQESIVAVGGGT